MGRMVLGMALAAATAAAGGVGAAGKEAGMAERNDGVVLDTATFAAGCFWGVEDAFSRIKGVVRTTVGYTGGWTKEPDYGKVCSGTTGHAEAVQVEFDPARVGFRGLLKAFRGMVDPFRGGPSVEDPGYQYRSEVFYRTPEQKAETLAWIAELESEHRGRGKVTIRVEPEKTFWPAEEYHQKYYAKHRGAACSLPEN